MRTHVYAFLMLAFCMFLSGCKGNPEEPEGVAGQFELVAVDGEALPARVGDQWTQSGRLELDADGSYTMVRTDSVVTPLGGWEKTERHDYGFWTKRGDSLFLQTSFAQFGFSDAAGIATPQTVSITVKSLRLTFQH